jgi:DNA-binding transcriptional LysR family regulator
MRVFTRIVELGGFAKAADSLQLPRASVTILIKQLEAHLGVQLLQRTTRQINLTLDGAAYYPRCVRLLADLEETEAVFSAARNNPKGLLRVDMPAGVGRLMVIPYYHVARQLSEGRLCEVLRTVPTPGMPLTALYPPHRQLSRRVRGLSIGWWSFARSRAMTFIEKTHAAERGLFSASALLCVLAFCCKSSCKRCMCGQCRLRCRDCAPR